MNKRKVFISIGAVLFCTGLILFAYYKFFPVGSSQGMQIRVSGNQELSEAEIKSIVAYLLQSGGGSLSTDEIEQALLLNPRVARAGVTKLPGRILEIEIIERETAFFSHSKSTLASLSEQGSLLNESEIRWANELDDSLPIFYLTSDHESADITIEQQGEDALPRLRSKTTRDIIQLFKKTREQYAFLWQRIGEIVLLPKGQPFQFEIYPSNVRSKIQVNGNFDRHLLEKLWALFYYLEREKAKHKENRYWTKIEITEDNAFVKSLM